MSADSEHDPRSSPSWASGRWAYSRWDGSQVRFDLDSSGLFDQLADDLMYHGDVNAAMRRLMQDGMRGVNGESLPGIREILERLRAERQRRLESSNLGGVYDEAKAELADILDEERHAIDRAVSDAQHSGDERRSNAAESAATERRLRLDLLPDDLAGMVRELSSYRFESAEAQRRFERVKDRLRSELSQQLFDRFSEGMQSVTEADVERMKDMLAELNSLLESYRNGDDTDQQFADFMDRYGDFFPDQPTTVPELLESLARRMAAAQAMFNSMTPEQRDQLLQLGEQLFGDMDLQWQMDRLGSSLSELFPEMNWGEAYNFSGEGQPGFGQALDQIARLGDLDRLEAMLSSVASPAQLAEVDPDQIADLLDEPSAEAIRRLAEISKQLADAGLIDRSSGRVELTPAGMRALGNSALKDLFSRLDKAHLGQHSIFRSGQGHERSYETKPYEFGDPFRLNLERTLRNAVRRTGPRTPVRLIADDFEIDETEHLTRSATVLMLDLSMSMPMRDNFLPAKRVAIGLHHLISTRFPRDYLGLVGFGESAHVITPSELPSVSWDLAYGTNMHHGFALARQLLASQAGTKQILMITDGEPTAHVMPSGDVYFNYPPTRDTIVHTLREVQRCTRAGIRINTFVLDATSALTQFIEQMARINGGRAFLTTNDSLGEYVLVDYLDSRRSLTRRHAS